MAFSQGWYVTRRWRCIGLLCPRRKCLKSGPGYLPGPHRPRTPDRRGRRSHTSRSGGAGLTRGGGSPLRQRLVYVSSLQLSCPCDSHPGTSIVPLSSPGGAEGRSPGPATRNAWRSPGTPANPSLQPRKGRQKLPAKPLRGEPRRAISSRPLLGPFGRSGPFLRHFFQWLLRVTRSGADSLRAPARRPRQRRIPRQCPRRARRCREWSRHRRGGHRR